MRLSDKVIVVTGAAGLLGIEHAKAVLSQGGSVALIDINFEKLSNFSESLSAMQREKLRIYDCDITNEVDLVAISRLIQKDLGIVTGLVNNAAINAAVETGMDGFIRFENFPVEVWNKEISVGLTGAMLCSKVFGSAMVANNIAGSIVHIASDHGIIAPNQTLYMRENTPTSLQPVKPVSYSVVKHGIIGLSRYISTYWCQYNIRSNALCPGGVINGQDENFLEKVVKLVPLGRLAKPEEYQGALVFLLSDESSYMTGATLVIDGGRSVW
jgi:NAD(P)-dependent dehydrogenase (short-subunit alcohol dehydrogenase family)